MIDRKELIPVAIYFVTGVATTMLTQMVSNQHFDHSRTLMRSLANYLGNSLAFLVPFVIGNAASTGSAGSRKPSLSFLQSLVKLEKKTLSLLGLLVLSDFMNSSMLAFGVMYAGSGMFQVIYSCSLIWVALASRFLLRKTLTTEQWFGVLLCMVGMAVSSLDLELSQIFSDEGTVHQGAGNQEMDTSFATGEEEQQGTSSLTGFVVSVVASLTGAFTYTMAEIISLQADCPQATTLCSLVGITSLILITIYCINFTIPRWHELVTEPMEAQGGSLTIVFWLLLAIGMSQLVHNVSYFTAIHHSGAVTMGLIAALRGVSVFLISHLMYCDSTPSQCLTLYKGLATFFIASGIVVYSLGKGKLAKEKKRKAEGKPQEDIELL